MEGRRIVEVYWPYERFSGHLAAHTSQIRQAWTMRSGYEKKEPVFRFMVLKGLRQIFRGQFPLMKDSTSFNNLSHVSGVMRENE